MGVYVINGRKIKRAARFALTLAAFMLLLTVVLNIALAYFEEGEDSRYVNAEEASRIIIIDPGHGGVDTGAIGVDGVFEKDLNLEISLILGELLREHGFTVVYTRTTDRMLYREEENIKGMRKFYDLKNRCAVAEGYEDAIFLSLHMNSFGASQYSGLQVYYANNNENSKALAEKIQCAVRRDLQAENKRQIKNGKDLYILDNCKALSVLIECGFLSNAEECKKLSEKEYQKQLSSSIICGIIEYIEATSGEN